MRLITNDLIDDFQKTINNKPFLFHEKNTSIFNFFNNSI